METRKDRSQSVSSSFAARLGFGNQSVMKREFPANILKMLTHKSYEKRREANNGLQEFLKGQIDSGNAMILQSAIEMFKQDFVNNSFENMRGTGLLAYSAIATSNMSNSESDIIFPDLIRQALLSLKDPVPKIRVHAQELLYNITKNYKENILKFLSEIFRGLMLTYNDTNPDVKLASEKLDCLLKYYLVEYEADKFLFNITGFLDIISESINVSRHPELQKLIISWLIILDSIASFNLLNYLSYFLEGLFLMLESLSIEVQHASYWLLREILENIKENIHSIDLEYVIDLLLKIVNRKNTHVRSEVVTWIHELVKICGSLISIRFPNVLKSILGTLSDCEVYIVELSEVTHATLLELFRDVGSFN